MPSMLKSPEAAKDASVDDLRHTLLTLDGAGVRTKTAALDELLRRAETYIPGVTRRESTRAARVAMYTVGIEDGGCGVGMIAGPDPDEREMLKVSPLDASARILRHNADGSMTIVWRWSSDRWVRVAT